jgi:hypothetical protein
VTASSSPTFTRVLTLIQQRSEGFTAGRGRALRQMLVGTFGGLVGLR